MSLTFSEARHLLARLDFGAKASSINHLVGESVDDVIVDLIDEQQNIHVTPAPDWIEELPPPGKIRKSMSNSSKKLFRKKQRIRARELKSWWFKELIHTRSPLTERMTLFWHNHFTTSSRKVKWPGFLFQQNALLRWHALGNFSEMLRAIAKDPAMLLYLDNNSNNKNKPNENFARELLELFTLGEGHYTENDIKQAARAFTGWKINRKNGGFRLARKRHDFGNKTFMARHGDFDGNDIINILLEQPQVAVHITKKLWREFISPIPYMPEVQRLAKVFRDNDYEIGSLLQAMFLSEHFWVVENRGTLIKSPVDLIVGSIRNLNIQIHDTGPLSRISRRLGQDLFDPPNVKGWVGGTDWITSDSLLARQAFLHQLLRSSDQAITTTNDTMSAEINKKPDNRIKRKNKNKMQMAVNMPEDIIAIITDNDRSSKKLQQVLLPLNPVNSIDEYAADNELLKQYLVDPAYQLR